MPLFKRNVTIVLLILVVSMFVVYNMSAKRQSRYSSRGMQKRHHDLLVKVRKSSLSRSPKLAKSKKRRGGSKPLKYETEEDVEPVVSKKRHDQAGAKRPKKNAMKRDEDSADSSKPVDPNVKNAFEKRIQDLEGLLGNGQSLLNPFQYDDEPGIKCKPLLSAANRERICTYKLEDDLYVSKVLVGDHAVWEDDIVNSVKRVLEANPDMQFIDIGANIGVYAITVASMKRQVVGVEPYPPNLVRLSKSLRLNPHLLDYTTIVTNALSDVYEVANFWKRDKHPGATQVHSDDDRSRKHYERLEESVNTILLDDILPILRFRKALLKMDIEGGERKALAQASNLFEHIDIPYVYMEWDNKWRTDPEFFINFFEQRGYTVHDTSPKFNQLEMSVGACAKWPFDVVFIKKK